MNKHIRVPVNPDGAAARHASEPTDHLSPAETNDGHLADELQGHGAVAANQTISATMPICDLSDRHPSRGKRKRAAADPAKPRLKPRGEMQDQRQFDGQSKVGTQKSHAVDRSGHPSIDSHSISAGSDQPSGGHTVPDTHSFSAAAGDDVGHPGSDAHGTCSPVIAEIIQLWRMRQRWHRAEKSLILQGKAICRAFLATDDLHHENEKVRTKARDAVKARASAAFDEAREGVDVDPTLSFAVMPFITSIERTFAPERAALEKRLKKLARQLPIWTGWALDVRGFGELSLAAVVGEAGNLTGYSNPAKLWKRMGLAVVRGERQRRKTDAEAALEHGYNPSRRSVMWNIGGGLIGGMGHGPRPRIGEDVEQREDLSRYQKMFVRFVREEVSKVSPTWNGLDHVREPVERKGEIFESYSAHAANRAKRRVEKQFLVDLLIAWRAAGQMMLDFHRSPAGSPTLSGSDAGVVGHKLVDLHMRNADDELPSGEE